jgi:glycosyltransferase involved in cell wall biosynthesis
MRKAVALTSPPLPVNPIGMDGQTSERVEQRPAPARPRVLHVLAALSRGGVETWLMHMLRYNQMFSVEHEVLLTKSEPGDYEAEARRLGIRIHRLPIGPSKSAWLRNFRQFLEANGPFAAVHSHVYFFSAPILSIAKAAKVPVRIAHCHAARSRGGDHQTLRHKIRRSVATRWLKRVATLRIGISNAAIEEIAGSAWNSDPACTVLLYGFDFSRYHGTADRAVQLRRELGIDDDAAVVGHVGRFEPVKNHGFLLAIFSALLRHSPKVRLVLVGDGPTRGEMAAKAESLGITGRVIFAGTTDDVPAYMRMFDAFVLPSFSEGLGIVCVEAQAAGTPALVSDAVAHEAAVVEGAVQFLPLAAGAEIWADAIADALKMPRSEEGGWLDKVERSQFAIGRCIDELDGIYRSEMARSR